MVNIIGPMKQLTFFRQMFFLLCVVILSNNNVYAQNEELVALLDQYPERTPTMIDLYSLNSKNKITSVDISTGYTVVKRLGKWTTIQLSSAMVPLWVSGQYVEQHNGQGRVSVDRLNVRLYSSVNAPLITKVTAGYTSKILASNNGFVQIHAPLSTVFLVSSKELKLISAEPYESQSIQSASTPDLTLSHPVEQYQLQAVIEPDDEILKPVIVNDVQRRIDDDHIIAPGDAISLFVFGEPDLSIDNIRVPESGNVSLPLIGAVAVAGQTTKQIEQKIRLILESGYVNNPRLSVSIFSYRPIFIRGAVKDTGAFPYTEGLSIAKVIALAGGAINSAKLNGISILRDGVVIQEGIALDSQYQVASGDVITVDEELGVREDENLFIYLHGEVVSPGEYRYRRGLTVEKAIVLAGGFTLRASKRKTRITRYVGVEENQEPIKLKNVKLYTTVLPGDVISVKASLF